MPEEYLQAAFEIKASCDEISRRILRWHWENKPGAHSFESLLEHLERRQEESPAYYGHMPDIGRKTSWQQLDTTLCMRVLLDPENDASQPLDLLGSTAHPGSARRACNAVRMARNEAAHAADRSSGGRAAILFDEAVECIEEAYAGTAFSERELAKYYELSNEYLRRCGVGGKNAPPPQQEAPESGQSAPEVNVYPTGAARQKAAAAREKNASAARAGTRSGTREKDSKTGASGSRGSSSGKTGSGSTSRKTGQSSTRSSSKGRERPAGRAKKEKDTGSQAALFLAVAALVIGLLMRAAGMGLWIF